MTAEAMVQKDLKTVGLGAAALLAWYCLYLWVGALVRLVFGPGGAGRFVSFATALVLVAPFAVRYARSGGVVPVRARRSSRAR